MSIMHRKQKFLKIIYFECKKMFNFKPSITVFCILMGTIISVLLYFQTIFLKKMFSSISIKNIIPKDVIMYFIILCIIIIIADIINGIYNYLVEKQSITIVRQLSKCLFNKVDKFRVLDFEDPEFLNKVNKATKGIGDSTKFFIKLQSLISTSLIYLILISFFLYSITPVLLIVILLTFIPSFISYIFRNKIKYITEEELAIERRKMFEYEMYICDKKYFKETRHLNAINFFKNKFIKSCEKFNNLNFNLFKKVNNIKLLLNIVKFISFITILLLIYYLSINKYIGIAAVGAVISTITTIYDKMVDIFNSKLSNIVDMYNGMRNLHMFFELKVDEINNEIKDNVVNIKMDNISFQYPNSNESVIKNVNLEILHNDIVAIVGENGSGKTTLAKLIAGLYCPTEGDIKYNDVSINNININLLYSKISIAFQNYKQYVLSVKENIAISDISNFDNEKINRCINDIDLCNMVNCLENKSETLLTKEYGGIDLSLGQWQRIAIARANYKSSSIIIFDEPTASIDPLQETDLINKFMKMSENKTIILVTHRIGAAKLANKIVVMKKGTIVDIGVHDELLKYKGEYKKLYDSQKQWYV